jgi:hypothetical protein
MHHPIINGRRDDVRAEQSSFYLDWTKERIDEMDASLASFEAKAGQVQADSKVKADQQSWSKWPILAEQGR